MKKWERLTDLKKKSKSVSSDSFGQLQVTSHDCHSFGMDSAQVGVFKQRNKVSFSSFLQGQNSRALEPEFLFPFMGDFSDHSLERKFSDEKISGLLVFPDFSQSHCSGFESVWFLDASGDGGRLSGDFLGNKLLSGNLLSGGFPCSLFCSCHCIKIMQLKGMSGI